MAADVGNPLQRFVFSPYGILLLGLAVLGAGALLIPSAAEPDSTEPKAKEVQRTAPKNAGNGVEEAKKETVSVVPETQSPDIAAPDATQPEEVKEEFSEPSAESSALPPVIVPEPQPEAFPMELPPLDFSGDLAPKPDAAPYVPPEFVETKTSEPATETITEPVKTAAVPSPVKEIPQEPQPAHWVLYRSYYRLSSGPHGVHWDVVLVPVSSDNVLYSLPAVPFCPYYSVQSYCVWYSWYWATTFRFSR